MCAERELVTHGAGEDEERAFVGGEGCDVRFEGEGCCVFGEDVVEEGGVLDGEEHGGRGCCYYVALSVTLLGC